MASAGWCIEQGDLKCRFQTQRDETVAIAIESLPSLDLSEQPLQRPRADSLAEYRVIRRNGMVVGFEPNKNPGCDEQGVHRRCAGGQGRPPRPRFREQVEALTSSVVGRAAATPAPPGGTFHIEEVQDQVEPFR